MSDVSKVQGPSGTPDSLGKKEGSSVDSDKFKAAMRKRVTEVKEVDPDEQKKKKQQAEGSEEVQSLAEEVTTPPGSVMPFTLQEGLQKESLLDVQKPSSTSSLPQASLPSPSAPPLQSSTNEEISDVPSFEEPPLSSPSEQNSKSQGELPSSTSDVDKKNPPLKEDHPSEKSSQSGAQDSPSSEKKGSFHPVKTSPSLLNLEDPSLNIQEDKTSFFEQIKEKSELFEDHEKKTPEEIGQGATMEDKKSPDGSLKTPLEEIKEEIPIEIPPSDTSEGLTAMPAIPGTPSVLTSLSPPVISSGYMTLHPQVMELFDRMVGTATVMNLSGMTETVITLNAPQFASSVFFGAQITIQEFSTAPKAFNIQLNASPPAIALFQGNTADLMTAFQQGNFGFRVNRLDTGYLEEKPLFKRKESLSDEHQDQTETGP